MICHHKVAAEVDYLAEKRDWERCERNWRAYEME